MAVDIIGNFNNDQAEEIRRNLEILYGTVEGECAMNRDFGISMDSMDLPIPAAEAALASEIIIKTQKYEPRAHVQQVIVDPAALAAGKMKVKVVIAGGYDIGT
ncbi:MAG: GPW/gp25 family protein [Firmicutes bacterium]|nr:GPW/gp25 family protein [Bacillota bacterium]MDY5855601.1 GPW/gp25 family protein [Anaerovoracaceae bacterium]